MKIRIRKSNQQETKHPWTGIPLINTCSHNWTLFHDEGTSAWWKDSKYWTWMTVKNDRHSKRGIVFFFLFSCKSLTMISLLLHGLLFLNSCFLKSFLNSRSLTFPLSFLFLGLDLSRITFSPFSIFLLLFQEHYQTNYTVNHHWHHWRRQ